MKRIIHIFSLNWERNVFFFYKKILEDISPFCGATDTPVWTSSDVSSGLQSQSGQPYLHLAEMYVLHIPQDSPLVQHQPTSWWPAWQPSQSLLCTCDQVLVGLKTGTCRAADESSTD